MSLHEPAVAIIEKCSPIIYTKDGDRPGNILTVLLKLIQIVMRDIFVLTGQIVYMQMVNS